MTACPSSPPTGSKPGSVAGNHQLHERLSGSKGRQFSGFRHKYLTDICMPFCFLLVSVNSFKALVEASRIHVYTSVKGKSQKQDVWVAMECWGQMPSTDI